jgi:CheY-like chemotaxis protein
MISILYVDDETDFADICRLYLDKTGDFFIDTSESAPDAIQKLMHTRYDVIISDYHMPGMVGSNI